ncbi:MAG: DUF305 domain-containing protein [Chloroflexi bacterium]|nr:DUF305 domain-containing protein [Chloroflexota bacterium]
MMPGPGQVPGFDMNRHFIEEMIPHHEDAVVMAELALAQAEHQELRALAENIKRDQAREIEQMKEWYRAWYGTEVPPGHMSGHMPGMGMGNPRSIDGVRPFDKAFIEAMIPHHWMAVHMSTMALQRADKPELRGMLQSIVTTQTAEIEQMRQWYRTWYGTEPPTFGPGGHMMGGPMMGGPGPHRGSRAQ